MGRGFRLHAALHLGVVELVVRLIEPPQHSVLRAGGELGRFKGAEPQALPGPSHLGGPR
jgi:hypothetical protein